MGRVTKKINVLVDEELYDEFMLTARIRKESASVVLRPAVESYVRENRKLVFDTFTSRFNKSGNSEVPAEKSSEVVTTEETEEHFKIYAQIAEEHPELVIVADDGERYLAQSKILKEALKTASLSVIPVTKVGVQPVIDSKKSTKKLFKLR